MSGQVFWFSGKYRNTHLATRNPKFWTEIEPECSEDLFFLLVFTSDLNLEAKFRTEIGLLSLI